MGLVNFFNLACGSYLNRLREYSLRRVTGSRGRQLLGLLFTQAGLTVLLAFLVTGCLAELAASHLHIFLGSFSLDIERGVLLGQCAQYLAAVLLLTGMVCAGTVAYACRIPIQTGIRGTERVSRGRKHGVRNTLLGVQFLVCWVFVALARTLEEIERAESSFPSHERAELTHTRDVLAHDFVTMAWALKECQREDGFWNCSLMDEYHYGGPEATGTSLFVCGMAWGIRKGILSSDVFGPAVQKAWRALSEEAVRPDGTLAYVQGTGKEPKDGQPVSYDSQPDFDDFGVGCFLLAGAEMAKLANQ